jgi:DNA replication protein DnaC
LPGDPNCPICHGIGFVRQDLPLDHPDFGRLQICSCRQKEASQAVYQKLYRLSNLDAFTHMTFESFNTQPHVGIGAQQLISLTSALNHATQFAKSLKGWLLLMGGYGTGKTHLAAGVANFAVSLGVPTLFLTVPDLLDWLRFSYDSPESNFEERFEEIRNIKLLVLDDLGTQNATPWAEEKLFQILNYRYVNKLPTVLTTNQKLGEIEGAGHQGRNQSPRLPLTGT